MAYNFYIKRIDSRKGKAITLEEIEHILIIGRMVIDQ